MVPVRVHFKNLTTNIKKIDKLLQPCHNVGVLGLEVPSKKKANVGVAFQRLRNDY